MRIVRGRWRREWWWWELEECEDVDCGRTEAWIGMRMSMEIGFGWRCNERCNCHIHNRQIWQHSGNVYFLCQDVDWSTHIYCSHEGYQNLVIFIVIIECGVDSFLLNLLKSSLLSLFWRTYNSSVLMLLSVIFIFQLMVPIKAHIIVLKFPCPDMLLEDNKN